VAAYLAEWLQGSVQPRCRPRTYESYRQTVERYIVPAIGSIPLAKLEPADVARMLARLSGRGTLSPTTVRYVYSVLRIALGRALKAGRVVRNVCTLVDPPAKASPEIRPLTRDQVRAFLAATADDRLGPLYGLAVATGLRQGELLGLRWSDLDLDSGALVVRHTLGQRDHALAEPKTERAHRTLRLGAAAVAILREQRRRQNGERLAAGRGWHHLDFVFTTRTGTPLGASNVIRAFHAALGRAGLPHQRFHDLRHAYATLMLADGEELVAVSRAMGHATLSVTADVYGHVSEAMQERAAARMDRILGVG